MATSLPPIADVAGVIGTARHVDHCKTTLVRALTGTDTDRLPEEKRRGISIELGFARLELPSGRRAAVVDVPGHERFVRHMVAGASGIDLVLLVVAADEGVMPQTREHLAIALLLGVRRGVVALTKCELVEPAWLALVEDDVRALLEGTTLARAPMVHVSALTGQGLDELRVLLDQGLEHAAARLDRGLARLPVDRVFSVSGFGTVVTGTLTSGALQIEDRLELLPSRLPARVRGLEVHGSPVTRAAAGQRVAVNLVGVERAEVRRGDVLATPGALGAHQLLAVRLQVLPGHVLEHGQRLHLHLGTAEVLCRVTLLEGERIAAGGQGFGLLRLEEPLAAGRGDRFIVRSYSPLATLGGGVVLDVGRRYRRQRAEDLEALAVAERGDPAELLREALRGPVPRTLAQAAQMAGLAPQEAAAAAAALLSQGRAVVLGGSGDGLLLLEAARWEDLRQRLTQELREYHRLFPLRAGMPREELRRQVLGAAEGRAATAVFATLVAQGLVRSEGEFLSLPGFRPQLSAAVQVQAEHLVSALEAAGLAPPSVGEALEAAGLAGGAAQQAELLAFLVSSGRLVRAEGQLYFGARAAAEAASRVRAHLQEHGAMTVAQLRDLLGVTRKHAVPLAEYLDGIHVTRREGDLRRLAGT